MKYYLKKCGHQELGSVTNGVAQRGRYLFTSMNEEVLTMFPPLSSTELNDSTILPIIPLYSGKKVYCNFVYHNSKYSLMKPNGRNEYRLYLNNELEENQLLIKEDNIVVIRTNEVNSDGEIQTVYLLDLYQDKNANIYKKLESEIDNSDIRGGYGLIEGEIPEFEDKAAAVLLNAEPMVAIDGKVIKQIEQKETEGGIEALFNAVSFRDFVMKGYGSLCAITKTVIRHDSYMNLEAAHIKPKSHGGFFLPNNGIAMCRDMHWAFDKGFFTLSDKYKIEVHKDTSSEWLRSYDGAEILIPKDPFFRPEISNIQYHKKNVFGLFLTSGRLQ